MSDEKNLYQPHDSAFRMAMKEVRAAREMIEPLLPEQVRLYIRIYEQNL